jgi:hypothetical protein
MSSKVQKELESRIKKHVMLESELAKAKAKEKAVKNFKTEEIDLLKRKLDKEKIRIKHLKEKK